MAKEEERERSIDRAKATGLVLAATGLNALLPGSGTLSLRLGQHILDLVTTNRVDRLEDFHRRVFKGDISDEEVNARFLAMKDGDFQHLLTSMLTDIEAEKVPIYTAVYIHLVENPEKLSTWAKRDWVLAASMLHTFDYSVLGDIAAGRWSGGWGADSEQRLVLTCTVEKTTQLVHDRVPDSRDDGVPDRVELDTRVVATTFGTELLAVLAAALKEVETPE